MLCLKIGHSLTVLTRLWTILSPYDSFVSPVIDIPTHILLRPFPIVSIILFGLCDDLAIEYRVMMYADAVLIY